MLPKPWGWMLVLKDVAKCFLKTVYLLDKCEVQFFLEYVFMHYREHLGAPDVVVVEGEPTVVTGNNTQRAEKSRPAAKVLCQDLLFHFANL